MRTPPSSSPDRSSADERLLPSDARYPLALKDLQGNAPRQLWVRGKGDLLNAPTLVAVVGTRRASSYALRVTRELSGALARAGACVVSGMALGIDAAAHRAALADGGTTIAVLGTGLAVTYPPAHRLLQREICANGALISEMEPAQHATRFTFPMRNRIIAALVRTVIVVEAPEKSGALYTANHALDLGRNLGIVPGQIDNPRCVGSNRLAGNGAVVLATIEEALSLCGLTPPLRVPRGSPDGDEGRVWKALANGPLDLDSLCTSSGIPAARCLAAVTTLELAGSIECALTGEIRRR